MPLPTGQISMSQIAGEFGGTTPHSLSEYYGVASGIPGSGQISMSQFHGCTNLPPLGGFGQGGYLICKSGGTAWILAPASTEACVQWVSRGTAITNAQNASGCTGWFIPSPGQLKNPGWACRGYWDSWTYANPGPNWYWSSYGVGGVATGVLFTNTGANYVTTTQTGNNGMARAFRTVAY